MVNKIGTEKFSAPIFNRLIIYPFTFFMCWMISTIFVE